MDAVKLFLEKAGVRVAPELEAFIRDAWHVVLVLVLAWAAWRVCVRLIRIARRRMIGRSASADQVNRLDTLVQVLRYAVGATVLIVAGMLVLDQLGISIAPLIATAGVAGIAIGFGVQSLVKDYFTGIVLLLEDQIRKGDVIEAGGKSGLVEEMTLRYVRVRDYEGNVHFIPNGTVTTVTNLSREYAFALIDAGIAYGSDIDRALEIMREVAKDLRADSAFAGRIVADIEIAGVERWDSSAVILRARLKTAPLEQWGVRREYLRRLKYAFDSEQIEIPYPHVTVYAGTAAGRSAFPVELPNVEKP